MAKKTASATKKKAGSAKKPGGGLAAKVQPSEKLAAIVGKNPLTRADLTKKIWDYIKKNGLQDSKNKRQINADANLKAVFGGKSSVNMFEMTSLVNKQVS